MEAKYCVDCGSLEKRPVMAETGMFSGVYEQNGWYFRCKECGRCFNLNEKEMELQPCVCGKFRQKG